MRTTASKRVQSYQQKNDVEVNSLTWSKIKPNKIVEKMQSGLVVNTRLYLNLKNYSTSSLIFNQCRPVPSSPLWRCSVKRCF